MNKSKGCLVTIVIGLLAFAWVMSAVWHNAIDDGRTPPESAFPAVPPNAVIESNEVKCGSGGCWREMVIEADSVSAYEIITKMDLAEERCGSRNILTMSRVCIGADYLTQAKVLQIYMRYDF